MQAGSINHTVELDSILYALTLLVRYHGSYL